MKLAKKATVSLLTISLLTTTFAIDSNLTQSNSKNHIFNSTAEAKGKVNRGITYKYFSQTYSVKKLKNPPYLHERQLKSKVKAKYGKLRPVKVKWRVKMIIGRSTMNAVE
ncbi:TPA: hypothetical protein RUV02_002736 [Staphylococcus aureus]|nr:hypothetical protein [Staphylococcus aureus]